VLCFFILAIKIQFSGDGLIGDNHFDFVKYTSSVVAYNQKNRAYRVNNLPVNALGIFDNPAFTTTANFATIGFRISKSTGEESGNRKCRFNDSLFQYFKIY
jgi:hypothetical protein